VRWNPGSITVVAEQPEPANDVRPGLAGERTLLAYQRTSIALIVAAVGFAHFLDGGALLMTLCLVLVIAGGVAAVGGHHRYLSVNRAIETGEPLPSSPVPLLLTAALVITVGVSLVMVVTKAG